LTNSQTLKGFIIRTDFTPVNRKEGRTFLAWPAFVAFLKKTLDEKVPLRFQVKGFSMSPFVRDGDIVTVHPFLPGASPRVGDVVAFLHPETRSLMIHRVIRKTGDFYFIQGDGCLHSDGPASQSDVFGYVSRVERKGKRVYLAIGPERYLIAFLARVGLLSPLLRSLGKLARSVLMRRPA
jgi:signal peptidase I